MPSESEIAAAAAKADASAGKTKKDPLSVTGMLSALNKHSGGNSNILKESLKTIKETDGSDKKGDIVVKDPALALEKLKEMIEADRVHQKLKSKQRTKWAFSTSPHEQFGKTLDDTFMAFLVWARTDHTESHEVAHNISKAFRRLESFAMWMEESADELKAPLTAKSIQPAVEAWTMQCSLNKEGVLVWWVDMGKMDHHKVAKEIATAESVRAFVWLSHFVMYHPSAQERGIEFCENLDKIGFIEALTLMPSKLKTKLDKMTMGCLPIKMKKLILVNTPVWMDIWTKFVFLFLSKKIKSRFVFVKDFALVDELMGQENVPKGFGTSEGTMERDLLAQAYFS